MCLHKQLTLNSRAQFDGSLRGFYVASARATRAAAGDGMISEARGERRERSCRAPPAPRTTSRPFIVLGSGSLSFPNVLPEDNPTL